VEFLALKRRVSDFEATLAVVFLKILAELTGSAVYVQYYLVRKSVWANLTCLKGLI